MTKHGLCYECCQRRDGKTVCEGHHVFGHNDEQTIITIPGNLHRSIDRRREARLPILKELHAGNRIIQAAQTLVTAAEFIEAIHQRARVHLASSCDTGARSRRAAHWLLALHHWLVKNDDRSRTQGAEKARQNRDDIQRQSSVGSISQLCGELSDRRTLSLLDRADAWAVPAAELEGAIARQLRRDAASLRKLDDELLRRFGPDWDCDEDLPKWPM
jgi:hypothetical protein